MPGKQGNIQETFFLSLISSTPKEHMLENQSDPPQNCDRFWNLNARYDKSLKKHLVSLVSPPSHTSLQTTVAWMGKEFPPREPERGAFWRSPHRPCLLDSVPFLADVPLETLRPPLSGGRSRKPLHSPVLPRSSSGISGRQEPQQSPWFTEQSNSGGSSSCAVQGAANVETPEN